MRIFIEKKKSHVELQYGERKKRREKKPTSAAPTSSTTTTHDDDYNDDDRSHDKGKEKVVKEKEKIINGKKKFIYIYTYMDTCTYILVKHLHHVKIVFLT